MPKLWIGDKMYSAEAEVRDYCEKLETKIAELEAELEKHRWIPVSESLPKKIKEFFRSDVCFVSDGNEVWVAAYNFSAFYWQCPSNDITHWKPINKP